MNSNKGGRRQPSGKTIRKIAAKRYINPSVELQPYQETERVRNELIAFRARERQNRQISQDRERLTREALSLVQAELLQLPNREVERIPEQGTPAYRKLIRKEEKDGRFEVDRINRSRSGSGASDRLRLRAREREYERKIKELIENVVIVKLRNLLSDSHIEALQNDSTRFNELQNIVMPVIIVTLEDTDEEQRNDCVLCEKVFWSDRLRREHTRNVHYPYVANKALQAIQSLDTAEDIDN